MRVSVELTPRTEAALEQQLAEVAQHLPTVDTINIPDVLRFPVRSWRGCALAAARFAHAIPHLRAMDIDLAAPFPHGALFARHGIDEVLVVAGDAPADMAHPVYGSSSLDVIRKLRREHPELTVYAAVDPYRQGFLREREYAIRKLEAGAAGLFTQPFFDLRLMAIYAELLPDAPIFWGVTSVTSEPSTRYWRTRNQAVFPAGFEPTLAWNRAFAAEAHAFAADRGDNIYFMPIRSSPRAYLEGIV
jgi:methylenetetrahydrofolate reductase (NADPH)